MIEVAVRKRQLVIEGVWGRWGSKPKVVARFLQQRGCEILVVFEAFLHLFCNMFFKARTNVFGLDFG